MRFLSAQPTYAGFDHHEAGSGEVEVGQSKEET